MATYNGEKYIKEQIESILVNLNEEDELIISDDGSTDGTIEIINSFIDKRIKVFKGPRKGINKNFENAILNCNGDYIFLSDQDDYWYPNKVRTVLNAFKDGYILVQHNARVVDSNGSPLINSFSSYRKVRGGFFNNWLRNTYHGCLMSFSKDLVKYILPFPKRGCFHDQWIGMIANAKGKTTFIDDILVDYKRYGNNQSSFKRHPFFIQLRNRIYIGINLMLYFFKIRI